ncbi:MAG: hypothetical protein KY476_23960 [Planctomycetes bacterium]|nr:hypothetical protein [Planctomycetota bacterium]
MSSAGGGADPSSERRGSPKARLPPRQSRKSPPAKQAVPPPENDETARRRQRKERRRRSMRLVRLGLTLVMLGLVLTGVVVIGSLVVPRLLEPDAALRFVQWLIAMAIVAGVASVVGRMLCLVVPEKSGGRPFIYGAVACDVTSVVLNIVHWTAGLPSWLEQLDELITLGALVLFVLFLVRLAVYLKLHEAAKEAETLLGWGIWLFIFDLAMSYVLPYIPILGWAVMFFLGWGMVIMVVVMFVRYFQLLAWLRSTI